MISHRIQQILAAGGDVNEALFTYFAHVTKSLPAERLSLVWFDLDRKVMRVIAQVSRTGSEKTDFLFSVPEELLRLFQTASPAEVYRINEPEQDPVGTNVMARSGVRDWSLIGMPIKEKTSPAGGLFITTRGRNQYSEAHARFLRGEYDLQQRLLEAMMTDWEQRAAGPDDKEPVTDKYEFFRQVTRRLCGHLDLETGGLHSLQYLSRFLPASMLSIHKHYQEKDADVIGVSPTSWFNHFDPRMIARNTVQMSPSEKRAVPKTILINQPEQYPALSGTVHIFGTDWSVLVMYLLQKRLPLGIAALVSEGRKAFTEEHRQLLAMLHDPFSLALANNIKHREVIRLKNIIEEEHQTLQEELRFSRNSAIIGGASGLRGVMGNARLVAGQDSPVLLTGETGVGKEVIANFIHRQSARHHGPFIKVNCGALPETLLDSELFGHEKGAFTGAERRKKGRFERAHGGTLFLDEVAELPLPAQVRMLRVLQYKIIERLGGTTPIPVDIRVIAATHRNLEELVASGQFREDLWFRLNIVPIHIPPLRARRSDIPALVDHFIAKKSHEMNLHIESALSREARDRLVAYEWPGNVRELENVIERELILSKSGPLLFDNVIPERSPGNPLDQVMTKANVQPLDEVYRHHIQTVLKMTGGKINGPGGAAEKLKIKPGTLRKRMDRLGISYGWKIHQTTGRSVPTADSGD